MFQKRGIITRWYEFVIVRGSYTHNLISCEWLKYTTDKRKKKYLRGNINLQCTTKLAQSAYTNKGPIKTNSSRHGEKSAHNQQLMSLT